jgi:hypothetical protein
MNCYEVSTTCSNKEIVKFTHLGRLMYGKIQKFRSVNFGGLRYPGQGQYECLIDTMPDCWINQNDLIKDEKPNI